MKKFFSMVMLLCVTLLSAQEFSMDLIENMKPRNIGPGGMSGRVTAIDVVTNNPDVMYVGTASGGLWKSTSGGIKWEPIFDNEVTASMKHKTEHNAIVNTDHGMYEPLSRIIELQGFVVDPKGATRHGAEYTRKCLKLGGQWTWHNHMTSELELVYAKRGHITSFETAWELFQETEIKKAWSS